MVEKYSEQWKRYRLRPIREIAAGVNSEEEESLGLQEVQRFLRGKDSSRFKNFKWIHLLKMKVFKLMTTVFQTVSDPSKRNGIEKKLQEVKFVEITAQAKMEEKEKNISKSYYDRMHFYDQN